MIYSVAVVCVRTTTIPGGTLVWGSPVGDPQTTNNYVNTRVLSQCLLLPAHTIGNENGSTRILAHVLQWYAIVRRNATMHWPLWLE